MNKPKNFYKYSDGKFKKSWRITFLSILVVLSCIAIFSIVKMGISAVMFFTTDFSSNIDDFDDLRAFKAVFEDASGEYIITFGATNTEIALIEKKSTGEKLSVSYHIRTALLFQYDEISGTNDSDLKIEATMKYDKLNDTIKLSILQLHDKDIIDYFEVENTEIIFFKKVE